MKSEFYDWQKALKSCCQSFFHLHQGLIKYKKDFHQDCSGWPVFMFCCSFGSGDWSSAIALTPIPGVNLLLRLKEHKDAVLAFIMILTCHLIIIRRNVISVWWKSSWRFRGVFDLLKGLRSFEVFELTFQPPVRTHREYCMSYAWLSKKTLICLLLLRCLPE